MWRYIILFVILWCILWIAKPSFVYKYQPRIGKRGYDYTALFAGTLILSIVFGGIWYFLE